MTAMTGYKVNNDPPPPGMNEVAEYLSMKKKYNSRYYAILCDQLLWKSYLSILIMSNVYLCSSAGYKKVFLFLTQTLQTLLK